jgi:hypothetical protein
MTPPNYQGYIHPPFTVRIEADNIAQFCRAVGYPASNALHGPPTYMKVIEGKSGSSRAILEALGIALHRILHAEQTFEYHSPIFPGQDVQVTRCISDHYYKKKGAMEFLEILSEIHGEDGVLLGRSVQTLLLRTP